MKPLIAVIAAAAVLPAAAASAQAHDLGVDSRVAVRILEPTRTQQTEQERIRQQQEREREQIRQQQERIRQQQERERERIRQQQERQREQIRQQQERARQQQERSRQQAAERAQSRRDLREEQSEKISRTLKIGASGELELSNLSGDIIITRGGGNVQIEAVKTARARTIAEAREMLPLVNVEFSERGSRAEVRVNYPSHQSGGRGRNVHVSVQFNVTVPEALRVSASSISGNISVTDVRGDLNLNSTSGDIIVTNGARLMSAKSTSGSVEIVNLRSDIPLAANSVSGHVIVRQSRSPRMELGSISGNVTLTEVQCERLEAETLSGDLEFNAALAKNGRYDLSSHSGSIRVMPSGNTGFELDANSFSGSIDSQLTLKDQRQGMGEYGRRQTGGRTRSLRGVYGDGSASLDITTFSGSVVIGKK
jgi:DUF4097 and DUF4098 domain-containing protein YvlB